MEDKNEKREKEAGKKKWVRKKGAKENKKGEK